MPSRARRCRPARAPPRRAGPAAFPLRGVARRAAGRGSSEFARRGPSAGRLPSAPRFPSYSSSEYSMAGVPAGGRARPAGAQLARLLVVHG
jgi:hypothetical protein